MVEEKKEEPKEENVLEAIRQKNIELQAEISKREELLAKSEELRAREILGGKSNLVPPQAPKVETPKDYAERVITGRKK